MTKKRVRPSHIRAMSSVPQDAYEARAEINQEIKHGYELTKKETPEWLSETGRELYEDVFKNLAQRNLLKDTDLHLLALLVDSYDEYVKFTLRIREEGDIIIFSNGVSGPHPLHARKSDAYNRILKISSKFGLSPVDRATLMNALAQQEGTQGHVINPLQGRL